MRLENKTAVIYGAGGAIGGAVARAFAREGATVFLSGRNQANVDTVAKDIRACGGKAETSQIDALDEEAIDKHLDVVTAKAGRVDISFNAIGIPNTTLQGVPLTQLSVEQFSLPIATYTRSNFLTARLAARRMLAQQSGMILTVTPIVSRASIPLLGGFALAMGALEVLTRNLSAELAPHGIRVAGLRTDGMPETGTIKEVFGIHAKNLGITWEQFHDIVAGKNHRRRLPTLAELANVAVFLASDEASALTGTMANLSMGMLDD
ncbi:MAG: SDR family oxidoreductase [Gammaproteobacteria bacterium]|nr:MAG: SDR family oxidoreductase [Gammaproteobacteria bacterium]